MSSHFEAATAEEYLDKIELLLSISSNVSAAQSSEEVIDRLLGVAVAATGSDRGSVFLNDPDTNELYTWVIRGEKVDEIRSPNFMGIAGEVFQTGQGKIVNDVSQEARFNAAVDEETGYATRSMVAAPVRAVDNSVIGVVQILNKAEGDYGKEDLLLIEAMAGQAAMALQNTQLVERMAKSQREQREFLDVVSEVSSEIHLGLLLQKIMSEVTRMLDAERSTLFLNDDKTDELWSEVGEGLGASQIRFPNHKGIAGSVYVSGESINIPHAYADLRFNPDVDRATGFFTRSILCVPVVNKDGKRIGVTQVLNKRSGPFSDEDERRLKAFTAQVSIALENAKLFADVQNIKNYNESMLESMASGVVTVGDDGTIVTCNAASLKILGDRMNDVVGQPAAEYFGGDNSWLIERVDRVRESRESEVIMEAEMAARDGEKSVNVTVVPLTSVDDKSLGTMVMLDDISAEKRVKSTMARYMDPSLADRLLGGADDLLGGKSVEATVLFSDIRGFTTITEELGAQGTVKLLNEYFTIMVEALQRQGGMLDKFIGDAIMAVFGIPIPQEDAADRAMRTACNMFRALAQWNARRADNGQAPIQIGVGLNTDEVVSGNIGSPKRMDYTIIGDGVNLAARLESACKQYGSDILVSENTVNAVRGTYRMRLIDTVVVKGKTEPVGVYDIVDHHTDETFPGLGQLLNDFRDGHQHYVAGRFPEALDAFRDLVARYPQDRPSELYVERCEHLIANPPEDWDGTWRLMSK
ncbi:MAG: GAF domain-containing protein [Pseudomonadota bacterium]